MLFTGKNNREYESPILIIRDELGIKMTDLCEECGCCSSTIYDLAYGRTWPVYIHTGKIKPVVEKLSDILGAPVEELFPLFFCKLRPKIFPNDEDFISEYTTRASCDTEERYLPKDFLRQFESRWENLSKRTRKMLVLRYREDCTLEDIAEEYHLSRDRVRQILEYGLRKLRYAVKTYRDWEELNC